ncbi:FHA domain-containing protein [Paraglaciecola marina]|uniref:FHA domain-containing protein n=1 Tax=Paraglaciecola marina TaxID=2500157 RepID=UPI00105EBCB9|nr:FHA domain-containing protein [Paraglaciecola marina]
MALIQSLLTTQKITLNVNHTFGRDQATNVTRLNSLKASRNHATIAWDGEMWLIKDISSNGTILNNKRITNGVYQALDLDITIQFGGNNEEIWQVIELSPPVTGLQPLVDGLPFIPLHDVVILPTQKQNVMVYLSDHGQWMCEENDATYPLHPGDKVGQGQNFWQFVEGRPCTTTAANDASPPPDNIKFQFHASQNEEHVSLSLIVDNKHIDMGERNHHYLLLLLARQRLEDLEKGLPAYEQGWLDKSLLIKMTGIIEQHINIQIYRFRKQVANLLPNSTTLHQVIERRPGELRFAYSDIIVEGGFSMARRV